MSLPGISLNRNAVYAVAATLAGALVVITPLCGFFFDCGCTWPWAGLERDCNIHDAHAVHQCPWCVSYVAGFLAVAAAIGAGAAGALVTPGGYVARIMAGLAAFGVVALVGAWGSAVIQGYPTFIF